jgi:glucose-6-phosphate 1-dehydrogenase
MGKDTDTCDLGDSNLDIPESTVVVFGATGDLAARKIYPALYNLRRIGLLPERFALMGFARRELSDMAFRGMFAEAVRKYSHVQPVESGILDKLTAQVFYHNGDLESEPSYRSLAERVASNSEAFPRSLLFYFAVGSDQFIPVADGLYKAGLGSVADGRPFRRIVVEKPFGMNRKSASQLSGFLQSRFHERDIFRIDHYLGKETVQNLLYFRFANSIFEPLWNRSFVESVSIRVFEKVGVGTRGGYYDGAGAARDMLQNHLLQLLCLTAMEPPASLEPEAIRDEKVKVLKSIPDYPSEEMSRRTVRAQYEGYRREVRVRPESMTETFVSLQLEVDNWRFAGVPFILTTGKALDVQESVVTINFRRPPGVLFAGYCGERLRSNRLELRIQPDEAISIGFNAKIPGRTSLGPTEMRFPYRAGNFAYFPEAYERLLADALTGDSTLFIRADEVDQAWRIVDMAELAFDTGLPLLSYAQGSAGPDLKRKDA